MARRFGVVRGWYDADFVWCGFGMVWIWCREGLVELWYGLQALGLAGSLVRMDYWLRKWRGTSLIRKRPPPWDLPMTLGIGLL